MPRLSATRSGRPPDSPASLAGGPAPSPDTRRPALKAGPARGLRRAAAGLAFVPLLVVLTLLAGVAPVEAQTEVWSGTLTVRDSAGVLGCSNGFTNNFCSVHLTDDDFTHDSTDYAIDTIFLRTNGRLEIAFDTDLTTATQALTLTRRPALKAGPARGLRRAAAGLAFVPLLVVLTLLAGVAPVEAQTEVWSGTLTVRDSAGVLGCSNGFTNNFCSVHLTDDDFTHDSTDYAIDTIFLRTNGRLEIAFDTDLTTATQALTLNVDGTAFAFEDADIKASTERRWNNSGLSWTAGDTVSLTLTEATTTSTDATLTSLGLSGATLDQTFAAATETYTASVGNSVMQLTLAPATTDDGATVAYFDGNDMELIDAVPNGDFQANLDVGANVIKVRVTAADTTSMKTYTLTVVREAAAPTDDPDALLTANLTVGEDSVGGVLLDRAGYGVNVLNARFGALTGTRFNYQSVTYTISELTVSGPDNTSPNEVLLCFTSTPGSGIVDRWKLLLDSHEFTLEGQGGLCYKWTRPDALTWNFGDVIAVKMVEIDNTAPMFSSATVDGTSLVITFDEALAAAASLANGAFTVKKTSGGTEGDVTLSGTPPAISGATVTLTLATAVVSTDTEVKVRYTKPDSGSNNTLVDANGNEVATFPDRAVTNNTGAAAATVTSVSLTSTPPYFTDDVIEVSVVFSEAVTVTTPSGMDPPSHEIGIDPHGPIDAPYARGTGTDTLVFAHTVVAADQDDDGVFLRDGATDGALKLNDGTITARGVAAVVNAYGGRARHDDHTVNVEPTITAIAVTSSPVTGDTYDTGEKIEISVTFSAAVDVTGTGTPSLAFNLGNSGSSVRTAAPYDRGSGTTVLVFAYAVQAGDEDDNGIFLYNDGNSDLGGDGVISLSTSMIVAKDTTTAANIAFASGGGLQASHKVDGTTTTSAATVTSVSLTSTPPYFTDDVIEVSVVFSEAVTVTTPSGMDPPSHEIGIDPRWTFVGTTTARSAARPPRQCH